MPPMPKNRLLLVLPLILIAAAAVFRYLKLTQLVHIPALENFAPWMALAFTGTLVMSRRIPFFVLPVLLALIDLAATGLRGVMHWEALGVYGAFALAAWFASRSQGKMGLVASLVGVIVLEANGKDGDFCNHGQDSFVEGPLIRVAAKATTTTP